MDTLPVLKVRIHDDRKEKWQSVHAFIYLEKDFGQDFLGILDEYGRNKEEAVADLEEQIQNVKDSYEAWFKNVDLAIEEYKKKKENVLYDD